MLQNWRFQLRAARQAVAEGNWTEVLAAAAQVLELTPGDAFAERARRKAWHAVGLDATRAYRQPARGRHLESRPAEWKLTSQAALEPASLEHRQTSNSQHEVETGVTNSRQPGRRLAVWIDSVGGFLFCLDNEVALGQPADGWGVDIPIWGDLSRRHALLRRDGEWYFVTPLHAVQVDGQAASGPMLLRTKAQLRLGDSVALDFCRPHSLSQTAVLSPSSHHKIEPGVDGVVLMSESCVFGPKSHSHVQCPRWSSELVLFRRGEKLYCRGPADLRCDDTPCEGELVISNGCRLESEDFSLSFEYL